MKRSMLLVLVCTMITMPISAVNRVQSVRVLVSAEESETLIEGYLKREIDKLQGFEVAPDFRRSSKHADWQLAVVGVRMHNGVYAIAVSVVINRHMKPFLKDSLTDRAKRALEVMPEHYTTLVHTGYDLNRLCERIIVAAENSMRY